MPNWLNPLNKLLLMQAIRANSTMLHLPSGLDLSIEYRDDGKVWITPIPHVQESSFVPCGIFDKRRLLTEQFLED